MTSREDRPGKKSRKSTWLTLTKGIVTQTFKTSNLRGPSEKPAPLSTGMPFRLYVSCHGTSWFSLMQIKGSQLLWSRINSSNSSSMRPFLIPPEERAKSHHSLLVRKGLCATETHGLDSEAPHLPIHKTSPSIWTQADESLLSPTADTVPSTRHMLRRRPLINEGRLDRHMSQAPVYSPHAPLSGLWTVHLSLESVPRTRHDNPKVTPCKTKSNPDALRS